MVTAGSNSGELVTTSSELNSSDLQILVSSEKDLIVVKSNFSVAVFSSKTSRFVASIFKDEKILCVWMKNDKVGYLKLISSFGSCTNVSPINRDCFNDTKIT